MERRTLLATGLIAAAGAGVLAAGTASAQPARRRGAAPVLAVIAHPVRDYKVWRAAYDSAQPLRKSHGVTGAEVFQDPANPNQVVVLHRFATVAAATAFFADPALKAAMDGGGVSAPPTITIVTAA